MKLISFAALATIFCLFLAFGLAPFAILIYFVTHASLMAILLALLIFAFVGSTIKT